MIYKEVFDLRGTTAQQQIAKEALDAIKFPFERITFPRGRAIIGWANLNGQTLATEHAQLDEGISPQNLTSERMHSSANRDARHHEDGEHPAKDTDTEPLEGEVDGRKYVLGVFYPSTGNIYVDNALINYPNLAKTTISAEVAHGVDEFLPLTDEQRQQIMAIAHHGDTTEHGHTWWEKVDYGSEYYTLLGETFMILFTYAYSDLPFEGAEDFIHPGNPDMGDDIRRVLGIQRTDYTESLYPEPVNEEPVMPQEEPIIEEPIVPEEPVTPVEPTVPETPAVPTEPEVVPVEEPIVEPSLPEDAPEEAPQVEPSVPEDGGSVAPEDSPVDTPAPSDDVVSPDVTEDDGSADNPSGDTGSTDAPADIPAPSTDVPSDVDSGSSDDSTVDSPSEPTAPSDTPIQVPEVTNDEETTTGTPSAPVLPSGDNGGGDTAPSVPTGDTDTGGGTIEAPAIEDLEFVRFGKSKVYHLPSHYEKKKNGVVVKTENVINLRICKYCQKHLPIDILRNLV
jgi:hypothetical protein